MADGKQVELLRNGVGGWNKWREENPDIDVNLSKADFSQANLRGAQLRFADLSETDLSWANLTEAVLIQAEIYEANLLEVNLQGANLQGANLQGALFISSKLINADLTGCHIYGVSVWDIETDKDTKQTNLIITQYNEPTVMVDDLEVAQFIHLLLNREKLRNVLNTMTQKGVLILGLFGDGGLELLQAVAARIREMGYLPMLFDFDPIKSRTITQTVITMVGLARFVIADVSGPSVLKELEATVKDFDVPFVPIIEEGRQSPSMTTELAMYPWFWWPPVSFANKELLIEMLQKEVIDPAEEIGKERQERRAKLFPNMK